MKDLSEFFRKEICEPLEQQEKDLGADIENYRICAICLNFTLRSTYDYHMQGHGYETLHLTMGEPRGLN